MSTIRSTKPVVSWITARVTCVLWIRVRIVPRTLVLVDVLKEAKVNDC